MISLREIGIRNAVTRSNHIVLNMDNVIQDTLNRLVDEIMYEIKEHMVNDSWTDAKGNARHGHIVSGELIASIFKEQGKNYVVLGAKAEHSIFHEFGTSKQQAHPIFSTIINSKISKFTDILVRNNEQL
jgi:HK97 gp10 family phage protein